MSRRSNRFHPVAQRAGVKVIRARADERAAKLAPIVKDIHAAGITSLNGIAEALNAPASQRPRVAGIGMRRRCGECSRGRYDRVPTPDHLCSILHRRRSVSGRKVAMWGAGQRRVAMKDVQPYRMNAWGNARRPGPG
jgi:hypothetical protein